MRAYQNEIVVTAILLAIGGGLLFASFHFYGVCLSFIVPNSEQIIHTPNAIDPMMEYIYLYEYTDFHAYHFFAGIAGGCLFTGAPIIIVALYSLCESIRHSASRQNSNEPALWWN